jgi:hypothetical protein
MLRALTGEDQRELCGAGPGLWHMGVLGTAGRLSGIVSQGHETHPSDEVRYALGERCRGV